LNNTAMNYTFTPHWPANPALHPTIDLNPSVTIPVYFSYEVIQKTTLLIASNTSEPIVSVVKGCNFRTFYFVSKFFQFSGQISKVGKYPWYQYSHSNLEISAHSHLWHIAMCQKHCHPFH
jgi:hypothetical protein